MLDGDGRVGVRFVPGRAAANDLRAIGKGVAVLDGQFEIMAGIAFGSARKVLVRGVVCCRGEKDLTLIQIERRARTSRTVRRCRLECAITGDRSEVSVTLRGSG